MARKKITADLNGGDAVTAMGDLVFQVHDASDDSIISTANYAAIGSDNTNGTDGANITYTLNLTGGAGGNGQIILDGVDIGAATDIKIRCKDEAGNESTLSASYSITTGFKVYLNDADGQYVLGSAFTMPTTEFGVELALPDGMATGDKITWGTLVFSPLNSTQVYIGIGPGFDIYPLTSAEIAAATKIEYTYNATTFATTLTVDDVAITLDSTSGTKGAITSATLGLFIDQASTNISISYLKLYDNDVLQHQYDMDEGTGTVLNDTEGSKNVNITVGTGSISTVWVAI